MSEEFEKRGVRLVLLQQVRDYALSLKDYAEYWTISRIMANIVGNHEILVPGNRFEPDAVAENTLTYDTRLSMIDMLKVNHSGDRSAHPKLGVTYETAVSEKANIFLSFAYASNFIELVEALEIYIEKTEGISAEDASVWFDLFVNNQWKAADMDFTWWRTTFKGKHFPVPQPSQYLSSLGFNTRRQLFTRSKKIFWR